MKVKNILIIGLGSMGERYFKIIRKNYPNIQIGLCRSRKNINELKTNKKKCIYFDTIDSAILSKPDFAILCNPSSFRTKLLKKLIENKIDLIIEKPVSNSSKNLIELDVLAKRKKVKILVGYNLRYLESLKYFKKIINDNIIGKWISVHSDVGQNIKLWRKNKDYRESVSISKKLGGGVLLELSHELDYINWIFGPLKWVQAKTISKKFFDSNVEYAANLIIGTKKIANHELITVKMDFVRYDKTRTCYVIGENGSILWDCNKNLVKKFDINSNRWRTIFKGKDNISQTYVNQIETMMNLKKNNLDPYVKFEDGVKVVNIIEAAKLSSRQSKKILIK